MQTRQGADAATYPDSEKAAMGDDPAAEPGALVAQMEIGPTARRKCRDVFWMILFVLFWVGMFAVAGVAISQGDLGRLKYGKDSQGNWCNTANVNVSGSTAAVNTVGMPYLYYFIPINGASQSLDTIYSRCVATCPSATGDVLCTYNTTTPTGASAIAQAVSDGQCTYTVASESVLYRCVPSFIVSGTSTMYNSVVNGVNVTVNGTSVWDNVIGAAFDARSTAVRVFQDVALSWQWILVGCAVAIGVAFVWLLLVQYLGGWMLLVLFLAGVATLGGAGAYFIVASSWVRSTGTSLSDVGFASVGSLTANQIVLLVFGIIFASLCVLLLILVLLLWKRIALAVHVCGEASHAIRAMPLLVLLPVAQGIAVALLCAWVLYIWALCSTSGTMIGTTASVSINNVTSTYLGTSFSPNTVLMGFEIYYLFGLLWSYNVVIAVCQCTVAGAVCAWYWTRDRSRGMHTPILHAFYRCFRYHFGSLVLGALIVGLIQFIRAIIAYFQAQAEKSHNALARYLLCCLQCCCGCLEYIVKVINKNAYIIIAMDGAGFFKAARQACALIASNPLRIFVLSTVIDLFLLLGKLCVASAAAMVTLALVQSEVSPIVSSYIVPVLLTFVFAYFIAAVFFSVVSLATSTIFVCFCKDESVNDGSAAKPYYMPDSLRRFVAHARRVDGDSDAQVEKSPKASKSPKSPEMAQPASSAPRGTMV